MESEKFKLTWNDFASNLGSSLRDLRAESDLFDVSLLCGDQVIKAHKLVLSACSPFFRTMFRLNHHQHPLIYLRGVKSAEISAILNFIYYGEVDVATEDLKSFLSVAEDLKIKGLTDQQPKMKQQQPTVSKVNNNPAPGPSKSPPKLKPKPKPVIQEVFSMNPLNEEQVVADEENEDIPKLAYEYPLAATDDSIAAEEEEETYDPFDAGSEDVMNVMENGGNQDEIIDAMIESILVRRNHPVLGTMYECSVCLKSLKKKDKMQAHAEIHLKGFTHKCKVCGRNYKTRPSLKVHNATAHKNERGGATINNMVKMDTDDVTILG